MKAVVLVYIVKRPSIHPSLLTSKSRCYALEKMERMKGLR